MVLLCVVFSNSSGLESAQAEDLDLDLGIKLNKMCYEDFLSGAAVLIPKMWTIFIGDCNLTIVMNVVLCVSPVIDWPMSLALSQLGLASDSPQPLTDKCFT